MATHAEIFRVPEDYALTDDDGAPLEPGWYFWYCMPGCLPDSDAFGPHASAADAERAARADDDDDDDDGAPCPTCGEPLGPNGACVVLQPDGCVPDPDAIVMGPGGAS